MSLSVWSARWGDKYLMGGIFSKCMYVRYAPYDHSSMYFNL